MKTKEAPKKLYITYKGYGVFDDDSTVERTKDSQTEYTRTDAFIEKAFEWIRKEIRPYYSDVKYKYEDFRKYMKG